MALRRGRVHEATSSVDHESEEEIQRCIRSLSKTKTLIIISHRMSTLGGCEKIFRMMSGKMYEELRS